MLGPFLLCCLVRTVAAQEREPAPKLAVRPSYPRTNLSTGYEVVPSWPARPKDLTWGAVAGIAISPSDQIWTFNRGPVPVQVYTADGELVRSWGQGQFREPHQVRIDRKGVRLAGRQRAARREESSRRRGSFS